MSTQDSQTTNFQGSHRGRSRGKPNPMASAEPIVDDLNAAQLEGLFNHNLSDSNRLCGSEEIKSHEVVSAKMLNYCIRMLHSHGWVPRTVVRAMVLMEADPVTERSVKGFLYQALRQKRDEHRARLANNVGDGGRDVAGDSVGEARVMDRVVDDKVVSDAGSAPVVDDSAADDDSGYTSGKDEKTASGGDAE